MRHLLFNRLVTLLLLAICIAGSAPEPATAVNDCSDANYVRSFNPSLAGRRCHEVMRIPIRWSGGTAWFRVLALDDVRAGFQVNQTVAWLREVAGGIGNAMDQMGGLQIDDPTIMITNLPPPIVGNVSAWAYVLPTQPHPGQCLAIVFAFDQTYEPGVAQLVLSHELFHCIQFKSWPGSLQASGRDWWVEGSAEYFARLAAPLARIRNNVVSDFVRQATSTSLLDMSYSNVVFFSWLGGARGAPAVKRFLDTVAPGRDRLSYRAYAEAALSTNDWKAFATAFVGGDTIRLPGTSDTIGADRSALPRHQLDNGADLHLRAEALVVLGGVLVFHDARAHLPRATSTGPYGASWDGRSWADLPEAVAAGCDQEPTFFIAAMSASAAGQSIHVTDTAQDVECHGRRDAGHGTGARCLVGAWQMTPETLTRNVRQVVCSRNVQSCQLNGGRLRLTFDSAGPPHTSGTGSYAYEGISVRGEYPAASNQGSFEATINGTAPTRWGVTANSLTIAFSTLREIGTVRKVTHHAVHHYNTPDNETTETPINPMTGLGPFLGGRFTCSGNGLHISSPPYQAWDPSFYSFDFTRIR